MTSQIRSVLADKSEVNLKQFEFILSVYPDLSGYARVVRAYRGLSGITRVIGLPDLSRSIRSIRFYTVFPGLSESIRVYPSLSESIQVDLS